MDEGNITVFQNNISLLIYVQVTVSALLHKYSNAKLKITTDTSVKTTT